MSVTVTENIEIHLSNIKMSFHSKLIEKNEEKMLITAPFDLNGDPLFVPIGKEIVITHFDHHRVFEDYYIVHAYYGVIEYFANKFDNNDFDFPVLEVHKVINKKNDGEKQRVFNIEREHFRIQLLMKVFFSSEQKNTKETVSLVDFSQGGLAFLYSKPILVHEKINIELVLFDKSNEKKRIIISCEVMNLMMMNNELFRIGVRFCDVNQITQKFIDQFLITCQILQRKAKCDTCPLFLRYCYGKQNHSITSFDDQINEDVAENYDKIELLDGNYLDSIKKQENTMKREIQDFLMILVETRVDSFVKT